MVVTFIERKVFMDDGAKLYNVIKVGKTEKAVFIDTVYPQYLSKEEAQKVYAARNPYNFETEVCDKVEKEFSVNSKEELINIIESRGYDSYIEKKFLSFAEDLEIKTEEKRLTGKEISKILDESFCGIETIQYARRFENGDNRRKMIEWVMGNFDTTYGIARRLVIHANTYSSWTGYYKVA